MTEFDYANSCFTIPGYMSGECPTCELEFASVNLSAAIERLAASTTAALGVVPFMTPDGPNNWEDLQSAGANLNLGFLPVWDGASETSIYGSPQANFAFRFWHDMGHLDHDLSFSQADELALQRDHHGPIIANLFGTESLEYQLYWADTVGQIEYSVRHRAFPDNQREFAIAYVQDPIAAVLRTF